MSTALGSTLRVRTLMLATAAVAVGLWLKLIAPAPVGFVAFWAFALLILARVIPRARPDPPRPIDRVLFPALLVAVAAAEWRAARISFHTQGEIDEALHVLAIGLNLPAIGLLLGKRRRWAYGWITAVFLILVPDQLALLAKWTLADREARAIVSHVTIHRAKSGTYPADLSGYAPTSPMARDWVEYRPDPRDGFVVWYHLGSENTAHEYRPSSGWFYHPD